MRHFLEFTCVLLFALTSTSVLTSSAFCQQFTETDLEVVDGYVLDFGLNREKYPTSGCLIEVDWSTTKPNKAGDARGDLQISLAIFEDLKSKRRRADLRSQKFTESASSTPKSVCRIEERGKIYYLTYQGFEQVDISRMDAPWIVADPWMITMTEPSLVLMGKFSSAFAWERLAPRNALLWAEENDKITRGEWDIGQGDGRARVQISFSKALGNQPVFVRYMVPVKDEERFARFGKWYTSEISVSWRKVGEGYLPELVQFRRESYLKENISQVDSGEFKYYWNSSLIDSEHVIDQRVFDRNSEHLTTDDLFHSFADLND